MKLLFLLLSLVSLTTCSREIPEEIIYSAAARGGSIEISIKDSQITATKRGIENNSIKRALTTKEKGVLGKGLQEITLAEIPTYSPPSTDHRFDGALVAHLSVRTKDAVYSTQSFDHGKPPEALKELVNYLLELIEEK